METKNGKEEIIIESSQVYFPELEGGEFQNGKDL